MNGNVTPEANQNEPILINGGNVDEVVKAMFKEYERGEYSMIPEIKDPEDREHLCRHWGNRVCRHMEEYKVGKRTTIETLAHGVAEPLEVAEMVKMVALADIKWHSAMLEFALSLADSLKVPGGTSFIFEVGGIKYEIDMTYGALDLVSSLQSYTFLYESFLQDIAAFEARKEISDVLKGRQMVESINFSVSEKFRAALQKLREKFHTLIFGDYNPREKRTVDQIMDYALSVLSLNIGEGEDLSEDEVRAMNTVVESLYSLRDI